jgi:hypothetical protein
MSLDYGCEGTRKENEEGRGKRRRTSVCKAIAVCKAIVVIAPTTMNSPAKFTMTGDVVDSS